MDIRERIRKMASGEINAEEELKKYEAQLKQQQEEARRKQLEQQRQEKLANFSQRESVFNRSSNFKTDLQNENREIKKSNKTGDFNSFRETVPEMLKKAVVNEGKELASDVGKNIENTWLGLNNGVMRFWETFVRRSYETLEEDRKRMRNLNDNINKTFNRSEEFVKAEKEAWEKFNGTDEEIKNEKESKLQKAENVINKNISTIQNNIDSIDNPVLKKTASLAPSIGQMLPTMAIPTYGVVYATGSATGEYHAEALQRGMNEEEAKVYSGIMGLAEGLTDQIGIGKITKGGKAIAKNNIKQAIREFGIGAIDNALQEAVIEPISETVATFTGGKETANWDNMAQRMFQSGIDGGLTFLILGGVSAGVGKAQSLYNKIQNGETVTKNELNDTIEDIKNSGKVDVSAELKKGVQHTIEQYKNNNANIINNTVIKQQNTQAGQTTQPQNKVAQNQTSEQMDGIANNQQTLYNNNESESGINGEQQVVKTNDEGRTTGLFARYEGRTTDGTRYQNNNEKQIQRTKQEEIEYIRKTENQITKLNNNQAKIKKTFEAKGAKVAFYSLVSDKGGYYDNGTLYINQNKATDSQQLNEAIHEYAHYLIRDNTEFNQKISPIAEKIVKNEEIGNSEAIRNYIMQRDENINVEDIDRIYQTVVEEILADYAIDINNNVDFDIDNQYGIDIDTLNEYKKILNGYLPDIKLEDSNESSLSMQENPNYVLPISEQIKMQNVGLPMPEQRPALYSEEIVQRKRTLNPTEISNLKQEDASTTPQLKEKSYAKGNKQSSFFSNIVTDSKFLNEDLRQEMSKEENIQYYKGITNAETLEKAYNKLKENGQSETVKWHSKDSKNANAEDVVEGWILLKQYQDAGDYKSAVEVAKKMRDIGTTAGQTVQAYNILSRLTPEGMFYYAQSELNEAYNKMVQGKSKEWIEKNQSNFDLTPEETQSILDIMQDVSKMEDGYDKKVKLAEVQKIITDKIPATKSQSLKAWMRISMLFNPKTQVRNIAGNAIVLPVNMFSDSVSAGIDRIIAKKTGVRTTGNTNLKSYAKGFGKGVFESYNDFRKGINTRNIEGNRFEVTEGKSFNNKGIGKALNRVDNILSFMLDAGDRAFYEATFTNSINNQLVLNKTTEVTQDMIDIATNEALQRTWQDNNAYTEAVLKIRKILNFGQGYGLGDVLIPFAKTPANLTKAIVDYSPVGLVKTLATDVRKLNNSLENGQYTPQLQHKVVQNIGKGIAGSFLYILGYALASAGIASGEADDDKDVKNFMKNSLGINSYSIKIGDKSFSYDWAQPIATPIAIMSNYVKYSKDNPDANALEKFWKSMNIGTEQLLEQSFMQSLNTVLNGSGSTLENLSQAVLELPARAIPTLSKQIADMVDGTQRTSFVYGKPFESAVNSVVAKLPIASKTLPVSRDTLGNELQKYGGENNLFNVMFNPANTNKGKLSKAGKEIYDVYMEIGDTTIFPRTAPYYINSKGEKVTMTSEQRSEFQKVTGDYVENTLNSLLNNKDYKKLTNEQKASVINEIVSDSYSKAKYDVLKIDSKEYEKLRKTLESVKANSYYDYKFKTEDMKKDSEKTEVILKANYTDKEKRALYENYVVGEGNETYEILKKSGLDINSYMAYKLAESNDEFASDKKEDGTVDGKSVSGSAKKKTYEYVNKMNATYEQKLLLLGMKYSLTSNEKTKLANYINGLKITKKEKLEIYDKLSGFTVYKDGRVTWK